ncbi:Tn3 family transposase [Nonomuraea deserti]|uniref:Tn3 family transposase n=1 Tax=Nonomuraea deserti TaxID=1848322 RepID=UPI00140497CD
MLANCLIFHTALDMMEVMRRLLAEGWEISAEDVAQLSPDLTAHISRALRHHPRSGAGRASASFDTVCVTFWFSGLCDGLVCDRRGCAGGEVLA